jgi:hypothetical protein
MVIVGNPLLCGRRGDRAELLRISVAVLGDAFVREEAAIAPGARG